MTTSVSDSLYTSKLLNYFYERQAESAIGSGDRFQLSKAVFGTSSLVTKNSSGNYDIADIPSDFELADMTTQFCVTGLTLSYSDGIIVLRADLDTTQLETGKTYQYNTMAILDNAGKAVAVMCVQEDSLYIGKSYFALMNIDAAPTD